MSLIKKQFRIGGMTCVNCQNKIEKKLRHTAGVKEVSVSYNTGIAKIIYDSDIISFKDIAVIVRMLDYKVLPLEHTEQPDITRMCSLLVIIIGLYILLQYSGILNRLVPSQLADSKMGYGMLFVIGLITSVHCIAMCGGINLSQCIPQTKTKADSSRFAACFPALLYNAGRVISYTVIGFILGLVGMLIGAGSEVGVSTLLQGILKLIAGIFMVIMGLNMLGIFPWLRKFSLRMPKFFAVKLGKKKAVSTMPLVVGLLNGLMPCGPLQSMQIVALAAANPFLGALSMFLFSLGTVPLMLGFGSLVSALGRRFAKSVMSVGAVLVVVLGLAMLSQGGSLSGLLSPDKLLYVVIVFSIIGVVVSMPFSSNIYRVAGAAAVLIAVVGAGAGWAYCNADTSAESDTSKGEADIQIIDGVQVVNSTLSAGKYPDITVQAGLPVKWVINAPQGSINGCNYKMVIQGYGIEYSFSEGENVIEFTPTAAGTVRYTCWMGMIRGNIIVVDGTDADMAGEASEQTGNNDIIEGYGDSGIYYVPDTGSVYYSPGSGDSCCGTGTGGSYYSSDSEDSCCGTGAGSSYYSSGSEGSCCGSGTGSSYYSSDSGDSCCGTGAGSSYYGSGSGDSCCGSGEEASYYIPSWGGSCCD